MNKLKTTNSFTTEIKVTYLKDYQTFKQGETQYIPQKEADILRNQEIISIGNRTRWSCYELLNSDIEEPNYIIKKNIA
ncbi:MAG: hypothetical protein ABH828_00520 [archaeon]